MHVFLDFEASSLAKDSYPIEVAWVFETGATETHLIKPAPDWHDWDETAQAIHGIPRAQIESDGEDRVIVARRVLEVLSGHRVFASSPSWDGKWLSILLRSGGLPRHALRLEDTDLAQNEIIDQIVGAIDPTALATARLSIIAEAQRQAEALPVEHRALADAERERQIWLIVRQLAQAYSEDPA